MRTLAIVGVGLIGGSIALAARARGLAERIVGVDNHGANRDEIRQRCGLDLCIPEATFFMPHADLTIFCTPVDLLVEQIVAAARHSRDGALLTDVGSTKANIVRGLDRRLPPACRFVGSHPLAGSEKRGAEHAHANLFEGRVVVMTPTEKTAPAAIQEVSKFWQALGARVIEMTPEEHDQSLARTSHLPHLVASALAAGLPPELRELTATGFRDTTRVAAGDRSVWSGIFLDNREPVLEALTDFEGTLAQFRAALAAGDRAAIDDLLTKAKRNRDALGS